MLRRWGTTVLVFGLLSLGHTPRAMMQGSTPATEPIAVRVADVEGLKLQYLIAGHGPAIVLLHGYAEASRMWRPLMPKLASSFTVIAPDLPGIGGSDVPTGWSRHGARRRPHSRSGEAARDHQGPSRRA